jgi:uncharacterized protein YdcH (DUF465 family)
MVHFILGALWGFILFYLAYRYSTWRSDKKIANEIATQFKEVLSNLKRNQAVFVSRVNQTVIVDTRLTKLDVVNIVYLMDKQIVCIFKDNNCIHTTETLDINLKSEILTEINTKFNKEINDVIDVMGMTISREEFQEKIKEIQKFTMKNINLDDLVGSENELDQIINDNEIKYDVDAILDKISKDGIDSISIEEKEFLDNLNK